MTEYDFHAETAGRYEAANAITYLLEDSAESFSFFLASPSSGVVLQQEGVFRTNCLDCLDRTNLVQGIISQMSIEQFLRQREQSAGLEFWNNHSRLWADNGDALSKIYAGTGALKSSYTRTGKSTLAGMFADATKSVVRTYVNNFVDKGRQEVTDTLLGRLMSQTAVALYDPLHSYVSRELKMREAEFTHTEPIKVQICTLNLNGRTNGLGHDLTPILFPTPDGPPADIIAVGFQEIVELSPQQIMATDPARRQEWEKVITRTLNTSQYSPTDRQYVLLRSSQLVGCALLLFVSTTHLSKVKNVEGALKKTGMSGMAGNKGAVAVRLDFSATSMCFVTAHLAAGHPNVEERNRDYRTIEHGLTFLRGRKIADHDTIFWAGDFNYRINLPNESCRAYIAERNLAALLEADQLRASRSVGEAFDGFSEPRIEFMPTYRFNLGSDDYDTSEKMRIPAWTDRVLYKASGVKVKCRAYSSVMSTKFSDHKPVFAELTVDVKVINEPKREEVERQARQAASAKYKEDEQSDLLSLDDDEYSIHSNRSNSNFKPGTSWGTDDFEPINYPVPSPNNNPPAPPPPRRTGTAIPLPTPAPPRLSPTLPLRRVPPPFPYHPTNNASSSSLPPLQPQRGNTFALNSNAPPPLPRRTGTDLASAIAAYDLQNNQNTQNPQSIQSTPLTPTKPTPMPPKKPGSLALGSTQAQIARSPSAPQLSPQPAHKKPPVPRKPVALAASPPANTSVHPSPQGRPVPPPKLNLNQTPKSNGNSNGAVDLLGLDKLSLEKKKSPPAPPPPRKGATLLDDDGPMEEGGLGGLGGEWEVLVPVRKN